MPRSYHYILAALAAATLSLSAALPELQDDEPAVGQRKVSYTLKTGKSVRGIIVSTDGDRVQLSITMNGGSAVKWYDVNAFDGRSQVRLEREQVAEGDLLAQLGVAESALDKGLIDMSRTELRRCAHMLDADAEKPPAAFHQRALDLTVRLLEANCARGDVAEARSAVSRILMRRGGKLSQEEQARLLSTVERGAQQAASESAAKRRVREDAKTTAAREKSLKPVYAKIEKGKDHRRKGLLGSKKYTAASHDLRKAAGYFESAIKDIRKLREKFAGTPSMLAELDALETDTVAQWQDSLLSEASLELARGSFNDAMESVNRILVDDAENAQALAMRARIDVQQNDWGWGWGGSRRR